MVCPAALSAAAAVSAVASVYVPQELSKLWLVVENHFIVPSGLTIVSLREEGGAISSSSIG